jgi:hypothetical protein
MFCQGLLVRLGARPRFVAMLDVCSRMLALARAWHPKIRV